MVVRRSHPIALAVALTGLVGCTGGVASNTGLASFNCADANTRIICLQNCSLGCSASGCARTDIAQNETIILQFSDAIDPLSVNSTTIRLRTASGEQPVGQFFVNGNQVEFLPTLAVTSGQTFFGFQPGETYTMTIPGGDGQLATVRSTSGKVFGKTLTCTLKASLGIVDANGVPPAATMVLPSASQVTSAPRTTDIVLEFNELIDATPFVGGSQSPVLFNVRQTRDNGLGGSECDPQSQPQILVGTQRIDFDPARSISVLTFNPAQDLPNNACIEVSVTSNVADLAGRRATPQTFQFLTEVVPLVEDDVTEEFTTTQFFDANASSGSWGGGQLTFAQIGGDARHGEFSLSYCIDTNTFVGGKRLFRVNCNLTTIPGVFTLTGNPIAVTDGKFQFSRMQVPADVRLEFFGDTPPQITVAGTLEILGDISVAGASVTGYQTFNNAVPQVGGLGGVFGGNGGTGANRNTTGGLTGVPPAGQSYNGRDGGNARVLGGHAYATSVENSGGKGSQMTPPSGLHTAVYFPNGITVPAASGLGCSASAGGGGGSSVLRNPPNPLPPGWTNPGLGEPGRVVTNNYGNPQTPTFAGGPDAPGGNGIQVFPFPAGTGFTRSSAHFLVGGGGGGGAATQPTFVSNLTVLATPNVGWAAGCAGGGGGGAISLRAGSLLRLGSTGKILAHGGSAANDALPTVPTTGLPIPAPGGGGAGGSVVLQSGGAYQLLGQVDVRGGSGGTSDRTNSLAVIATKLAVLNQGGKGGDGFVRLEAPSAPPLSALATMQPAAVDDNVAALAETDPLVSVMSRFYSTGLGIGPVYLRYEIHATVDNAPVVFSDDPAFGVPAQAGAAVQALFQSARIDLGSGDVLETRPWRTSVRSSGNLVGIASDALNGFRWVLFQDRTVSNNVTIDKVVIVFGV